MRAQDIGRLLRTVSHLRASQIWHRVRLTAAAQALVAARGARSTRATSARAAQVAPLRWDHAGLAAVARQHAERRDRGARRRASRATRSPAASRFLGETRDLGGPRRRGIAPI